MIESSFSTLCGEGEALKETRVQNSAQILDSPSRNKVGLLQIDYYAQLQTKGEDHLQRVEDTLLRRSLDEPVVEITMDTNTKTGELRI